MVGKAVEEDINKRWFVEGLHVHGDCICTSTHAEATGTIFGLFCIVTAAKAEKQKRIHSKWKIPLV